jgi:hypothetical protein
MREQLGKPIPSPLVLGQVTGKFRDAVKAMAERQQIPIYQFDHKERKDDVANRIRKERGVRGTSGGGWCCRGKSRTGRRPACSKGW